MITTEWLTGVNEEDLEEVRRIRRVVFCGELKVPEDVEADGKDASAMHLLVFVDGVPAATGRLLVMEEEFLLGRIAVLPKFRGLKLGDLVVRLLIRMAYDMGGEQQTVHSQLPVQSFYEKLGFITRGEIFEEIGLKHITMVHTGDVRGDCEHKK